MSFNIRLNINKWTYLQFGCPRNNKSEIANRHQQIKFTYTVTGSKDR